MERSVLLLLKGSSSLAVFNCIRCSSHVNTSTNDSLSFRHAYTDFWTRHRHGRFLEFQQLKVLYTKWSTCVDLPAAGSAVMARMEYRFKAFLIACSSCAMGSCSSGILPGLVHNMRRKHLSGTSLSAQCKEILSVPWPLVRRTADILPRVKKGLNNARRNLSTLAGWPHPLNRFDMEEQHKFITYEHIYTEIVFLGFKVRCRKSWGSTLLCPVFRCGITGHVRSLC